VGTVEERVAAAEARVGEHSIMLEALRQSVDRLEQRFNALEMRLDQRFLAIDGRFDALDAKMSRQFQFLVGIQVTMFVTLSGAMIAGFFSLR
jgi:hypothetical protein